MVYYNLLIPLVILNFLLFFIFKKFAISIGFIDKSKKFRNPITLTSTGVVFYINLLITFILFFFLKEFDLNELPNNIIYSFFALTVLVFVSAIDDIKPIDPKIRLFIQLICIYVSITSIKIYNLELPIKISILLCLLIWVYILNITNFTDGSDGFLATNTIFLFINVIILCELLKLDLFSKSISIILLPSILFFLYFNKPVAKMYMGDSGSVLIGFINGFIFLELLTIGKLNLAIALLIYPLLDCSFALIRKTLERKMPWADTSNYSFLQPTIKRNKNKYFVFYINILFNLLNGLFIIFQIFYGWQFIILNIFLALVSIKIYENKY